MILWKGIFFSEGGGGAKKKFQKISKFINYILLRFY